jgi:hypothetical protein
MTWLLRVGLGLLAVQVVAWVVSYTESL